MINAQASSKFSHSPFQYLEMGLSENSPVSLHLLHFVRNFRQKLSEIKFFWSEIFHTKIKRPKLTLPKFLGIGVNSVNIDLFAFY